VPGLDEKPAVLHSPDDWGKQESWPPISPEVSREFDDHAVLWRLHVEHNQEAARQTAEQLVIRTAVHPRSMLKINSLRRELEAGQKRNPTLSAWRYFLARLLHEANLYDESIPMIAAIPKSLRGLDSYVHLIAESALDQSDPKAVRALYEANPKSTSRSEMIQSAAVLEGMLESEAAATKITGDELPNPVARITTQKGVIEIELFEDDAPHTVHNFVSLVLRQKYYDGLRFRPVIAGTTARLGDPRTRAGAHDGPNGPLWRVKGDKVKRPPLAGRLLAVPVPGGVTHGSQFGFALAPVVLAPDKFVVFGRIVKGMDVLLQLEEDDLVQKIEIISKRNHSYDPVASRVK
jgi:cyclophilin family peptidyl-prolyl cis-trans isomerase